MMTFVNTTKKLIVPSLIALLLCGCTSKMAKQTIEDYNRVLEQVQMLERLVSTADFSAFSGEEIAELYSTASELYYDYNPMDLTEEQRMACEDLKARVAKLRVELPIKARSQVAKSRVTPWATVDKLFEKTEAFPVYLKRG